MRAAVIIVSLLLAAPAAADPLRFTVGARVIERCSADPTAAEPRLHCVAAPRQLARYEYAPTGGGMTLTILF